MGQRRDSVYHSMYGPSHRDEGEGGKNELTGMSRESGKKRDGTRNLLFLGPAIASHTDGDYIIKKKTPLTPTGRV